MMTKRLTQIDYKTLLTKYMCIVGMAEGTDFLPKELKPEDARLYHEGDLVSFEDMKELIRISHEDAEKYWLGWMKK